MTNWTEIWGDGLRVGNELCDDGNNSDSIGCRSDCSGVLDGFIWVNGSTSTLDVCETVCGDGARAGSEICDDGNNTDSIGWENNWSGVIYGYSCSGGSPTTPDRWGTVWGDGIHMNGVEQCDDGNIIDSNDGCTNQCIIENKWNWIDDILFKSIWQPMWGNGLNDHWNEQWDDRNAQSEDGCDGQWLLEDGWKWINGDDATLDTWYMQPSVTISRISKKYIYC